MKFIDKAHITFKAGDGGNGIIDFHRELYMPKGGPSGGNGGDGGDIILKTNHNVNNLFDVKNKRKIYGNNGLIGGANSKHGKNAQDKIIHVPVGTTIYKNNQLIRELLDEDEEFIIARGGKGGRGNKSFATSKNPVPKLCENGDTGETVKVILNLKTISDIGLFGFPNVGKTSILQKITNSQAKAANYNFTTLSPNLGMINKSSKKIVIGDMPGIIQGAHEGKGLGIDFLKHIEKSKSLVLVMGLSENSTMTSLLKEYKILIAELKHFNENLIKKIKLIVLNKEDLTTNKTLDNKIFHKTKIKTMYLSSKTMKNHDVFLKELENVIQNSDNKIVREKIVQTIELPSNELIDIKITHHSEKVWIIEGKTIEYWVKKIPLISEQNEQRFLSIITKLDIEDEVLKRGGKTDDTIIIGSIAYDLV